MALTERCRFSDFVLARILDLKGAGPSSVDPGTNTFWHTILTLVLVPHPELSAAKKRVIELDYCMEDGQVALECRQAFLYYTMRRLGLHTETPNDPAAQQISLTNRTELQPYIDALTASNQGHRMLALVEFAKDPYERRARLAPGLLAALPLLVPLVCVYGARHPILTGLVALLAAAAPCIR